MSQTSKHSQLVEWAITCDRCAHRLEGRSESETKAATATEELGWKRVGWESLDPNLVEARDRTVLDGISRNAKPWFWVERDLCPPCATSFMGFVDGLKASPA